MCPSSCHGSSPRATLAKINLLSSLPLLSYPCSSFSLTSNPYLTEKILFAHFLFLNHLKSLGCDAKGTKPSRSHSCPVHLAQIEDSMSSDERLTYLPSVPVLTEKNQCKSPSSYHLPQNQIMILSNIHTDMGRQCAIRYRQPRA